MAAQRTPSTITAEHALSAPGSWPGLRTFRSARFRLVLAATLLVVGTSLLAALLVQQAADPEGQYAFDFQVYHSAAGDIAAGVSPYGAEMLSGPIPAQGALLYKYPPVLAQALVPLAGLPLASAALVWLVLQAILLVAGVWLAAIAGGAPRTAETLLWSGVAVTLFLPGFDTLWKGNVSGVQAFAVGLAAGGGALAGASVAAGALLKTTPVVIALPVLLARRRLRAGMLGVGFGITAVSVLASPNAWLDFVRVVPNLIAGPAVFSTNLAPDVVVALSLPELPALAFVVRLACIGVGIAALLWAALLVRQPAGWPAALTLAVAASTIMLSAIWYHYLAVLLPIAALAWWRAGPWQRVGLAGGAAAITLGLAWLPLAVAGAAVLVAAATITMLPHGTGEPEAAR